jgi:hypothetical protein
MNDNKGGRPTVMTEDKIKELEGYFLQGLSDRESCLLADIHPATLYDYCLANPHFGEKKELLKDKPKTQAKININKALNDQDKDISKWYLERKDNDFKTKTEVKEDSNQNITYQWANADESNNDRLPASPVTGGLPQ